MARTDVIPLLENPIVGAFATWIVDKPGPAYRTIEQVLADTPAPTRYVESEHGWAARTGAAAADTTDAAGDTAESA